MNTFLLKNHFKHLFHISDIHIRNEESYQENYQSQFLKTFQQIELHPHYNPQTALIVVTGDIFHSSLKVTAIAIELLRIFTEGLTQLGPTIIIPGNHDEKKDVGEYDTSSLSALFNYNVGETNNLFYLKDSGIYSFGDNLVFGHTSVIDKQLIKASDIQSISLYKDKIKIALFHGMLDSRDKKDYLLKDCDFAYTDFNGYDNVLLGDVHKYQNIANQPHIYYSGSLIQQNYGEDRRLHGGLLVWDLTSKNPPQFIHIPNDHQYITLEIFKGNIRGEITSPQGSFHIRNTIPFSIDTLPTHSSIKFKCTETTPIQIIELIEKLKKKTTIIDYKTDYLNPTIETQSIHHTIDKPLNNIETFLNLYHKKDKDKLLELDKTYTQGQESNRNKKHTRWYPLELKWENMFNYVGNHQLDFQTIPNGITSICGPNASGKSKLIEIYTLAIFGSKPNLVPHIISNGEKKGYTYIKIKLYEDIWEIKWNFNITKSGKGNTTLIISKNEVEVNSTDKKGNENTIKLLFGELDDLCNTHISKQGRHEKFIYLTPNEQGNLLTRLFETDIYEDTHKQVKKDIADKKKTLKTIENTIKTYLPSQPNQKNNLELQKTQLYNEKIQISKIIEELEEQIRTNDIHLEKKKDVQKNIQSIQQNIEKLTKQKQSNDYDSNIEDMENIDREDILKQIENHTQNVHPNLSSGENIDEVEKQLSEIKQKRETSLSKLEKTKIKLEKGNTLKPQIQTEISNKQSKKDRLLTLLPFQKQWTFSSKKEYKTYLEKNKYNEDNLSILENKFKPLNIQDILDNHQSYLKKTTKIKEARDTQKELIDEIKDLESYLQSDPYTYNQQCQNCLHNKKINHIIDKENKLATLNNKLSNHKVNLQELIEWIDTNKDLPNLYQDYQTLQQLRDIQIIKLEYQEYRDFLDNKKKIDGLNKQLLEDRETLNKLEKDLTALYDKQQRLGESIQHNTIKKKDLENQLTSYQQLKKQIQSNAKTKRLIKEEKHKLFLLDQYQQNKKIKEDIEKDTLKQDELLRLIENRNTQDPKLLKNILHQKRREGEDKVRQSSKLEHDIQELERKCVEGEEWKKQFNIKVEQLELLKTYQKITSDYPNYCNSKYIEEFQNNINFYLMNMTKDFSITIHYEKKDNKHDIQFLKNDSIPIEHCSGFEKFVISISIRIALSILSPTHSMNLMMIDEGFGVFDHRHNKQLLKMLEPLQSIFKQIFIITHIDELQYEIPNKIRIKNGRIC